MLARSSSYCALWVALGLVLAGCGQAEPTAQRGEGQDEGYDPLVPLSTAEVEVDASSLTAPNHVEGPESLVEQMEVQSINDAVPAELIVSYGGSASPLIASDAISRMGSRIDMSGQQGRGEAARSARGASGARLDFGALPAAGPVAGPPLAGGPPDAVPVPTEPTQHERYTEIVENRFTRPADQPLSTFSIDVDTASYSHMRRFVREARQLPPPAAVRIEEFLNYFQYDYAPPVAGAAPFAAHLEAAACPWADKHQLVRIGLKGKEVAHDKRPLSNLVFLVDVSGSMNQPDKLPLVKQGLRMLVEQLGENDRVAIAVYAGAAGLVLPSTGGDKKSDILRTIDALQAGGSTAGGAGIRLAYGIALEHFIKGGANRVILCTDGDFNVGVSSVPELQSLIEEKAKTGVFLNVLGFGQGNIRDDIMETLADRGNGVYAHIDTLQEAKRVFVEQTSGTLVTIAKDVKIQVEFNPARVAAYRLIALYEVVPVGVALPEGADGDAKDDLRYQKPAERTRAAGREELLHVKLRYKLPEGDTSTLIEFPLADRPQAFGAASGDFRFAAAVASYGMVLRKSKHAGNSTLAAVAEMAEAAKGPDPQGYRTEFIELVKSARPLQVN
jgi:Ca-activated chloride channel family protein